MRLFLLCAMFGAPLSLCGCNPPGIPASANSSAAPEYSAESEREADALLESATIYSRSELEQRLQYYPDSDQSQPAQSGRAEIRRDLKKLADAAAAARPRLLKWLMANSTLPRNEKARIAKSFVQDEIDK